MSILSLAGLRNHAVSNRRSHLDFNTDGELAIRNAVDAVEKMGAHTDLTTVSIELGKIRDKLADYVDAKIAGQQKLLGRTGSTVIHKKAVRIKIVDVDFKKHCPGCGGDRAMVEILEDIQVSCGNVLRAGDGARPMCLQEITLDPENEQVHTGP